RERLEHEDAQARQQGADDLERRILSGRTDERNRSSLNMGEEGVLLRFVEAVNLVDKENRSATQRATRFCLGDNLSHAGHSLRDGGKRDERSVRVPGNQSCECRLS